MILASEAFRGSRRCGDQPFDLAWLDEQASQCFRVLAALNGLETRRDRSDRRRGWYPNCLVAARRRGAAHRIRSLRSITDWIKDSELENANVPSG